MDPNLPVSMELWDNPAQRSEKRVRMVDRQDSLATSSWPERKDQLHGKANWRPPFAHSPSSSSTPAVARHYSESSCSIQVLP
jgi:hypothetical protein